MLSKIIHLRVLLLIPTLYIFVGIILFLLQRKMVYHPDARPFEECHPSIQKINFEGFRGYFVDISKKIAVVYHGNAGNACDRIFYSDWLSSAGYSTLLVEYPGYAGDNKSPNIKDILATTTTVAKYVKTLSPTKVVIIGESLGSGPASYHAKHENPDQLILITPFDSVLKVAQRQFPIFPVRFILTENFKPIEWAKNVRNVTILAAENDTVVPASHAQNLFESLQTTDKKITIIEGAEHNTIFDSSSFVHEFLKSMP